MLGGSELVIIVGLVMLPTLLIGGIELLSLRVDRSRRERNR